MSEQGQASAQKPQFSIYALFRRIKLLTEPNLYLGGIIMLIDFHTHAFPDKLAERAMATLSSKVDFPPETYGTISALLNKMDADGVDISVVCNIATNPRQNINVNLFAVDTLNKHSDRLVPLGSIHPDFPSPAEEIEKLHSAGIKGLKLHPDYMERVIDDPSYDEIFTLAAEYDMFILIHAGFDVYSPNKIHASPDAVLNRLSRSPKTKLIAAHFGGNALYNEVSEKLIGKNLFIDTSMGTRFGLDKATAEKMLARHGSDMILFGSDCPWCSAKETYDFISSLALTDDLKDKIFSGNAKKLLKI